MVPKKVPVESTKTVTRDCGHWETQMVEVPCGGAVSVLVAAAVVLPAAAVVRPAAAVAQPAAAVVLPAMAAALPAMAVVVIPVRRRRGQSAAAFGSPML